MTVHLAQIAAVQGSLLILWDLDERSNVVASASMLHGFKPELGTLVRVAYERQRPITVELAADARLTRVQEEVRLRTELTAQEKRIYPLLWGRR